MASQGHKNQLKGAIGPIIFQQRYGKTIVRSKPGSIRQTPATKSSSSEFQYCSKWSKYMRHGLHPLWLGNTDSLVSQRLTAALYAALQKNIEFPKGERRVGNTDLSGLNGFEINSYSPFGSYCKVGISVEPTDLLTLLITVPELITNNAIRYPEGCTDAELICCITMTNIETGELINTVSKKFTLAKSPDTLNAETFETEPLPEDCIIVVAAQLVYYGNNKVSGRYALNTKKLNPGTLLRVGV